MEKKFDFVIILFIISSILLFSSSYLMYRSLTRSLDFINNVIQCTGTGSVPEDALPEQSSFKLRKEVYL